DGSLTESAQALYPLRHLLGGLVVVLVLVTVHHGVFTHSHASAYPLINEISRWTCPPIVGVTGFIDRHPQVFVSHEMRSMLVAPMCVLSQTNHANAIPLFALRPSQPSRCIIGRRFLKQ